MSPPPNMFPPPPPPDYSSLPSPGADNVELPIDTTHFSYNGWPPPPIPDGTGPAQEILHQERRGAAAVAAQTAATTGRVTENSQIQIDPALLNQPPVKIPWPKKKPFVLLTRQRVPSHESTSRLLNIQQHDIPCPRPRPRQRVKKTANAVVDSDALFLRNRSRQQ
jgi:hypothetical protein